MFHVSRIEILCFKDIYNIFIQFIMNSIVSNFHDSEKCFLKKCLFVSFLMAINFLFIGFVDAFQYNLKATNPISEAVFDLIISITIPIVIYINVERSKKELSIAFYLVLISFFSSLVGLDWFCFIAYDATKDLFFIKLLILNLAIGFIFFIVNLTMVFRCRVRYPFCILFIFIILNILVNLIFLS